MIHDWAVVLSCRAVDDLDDVLWGFELGRMSDSELRRLWLKWGHPAVLAEVMRRKALS